MFKCKNLNLIFALVGVLICGTVKGVLGLESWRYRKEIIIDNTKNTEAFKNFQVYLKLNTLSLITEGKLSLDCGNIRFTDSDKKTEIMYWMKEKSGKDTTEFWLRVPEILPNSKKSIYVYYGDENIPSASNFNKVFAKTNKFLVARYYLNQLDGNTIIDFSGNKNDGKASRIDLGTMWADIFDHYEEGHLFFNHWGEHKLTERGFIKIKNWITKGVYFEVPASQSLNFNKSQGTIEMWVKPLYSNSGDYQRLVIDTNWQIELGIHPKGGLYFYPAQAGKNNYNMINTPLKENKWNHIIVTWNFKDKQVNFYINGKKKKNDIENVPKYWKEIAKTGNWQFGGTSLKIDYAYAGYIDGIRIYNKSLKEEEAKSFYRDLRHPIISFGREELISMKEVSGDLFNLSLIEKINSTDKINLDIYYAMPIPRHERGYKWSGYPANGIYFDSITNEYLFVISKYKDSYIPILGRPGHNTPCEGVPISCNDSFLLSYVGLKISSPKLIKRLKIEIEKFDWESVAHKKNNYFKKLIPMAYACGHYAFRRMDAKLTLIGEKKGIHWYQLEKPIFVNKATKKMQLYYMPSGEEGKISIQIADMIFTKQNKKYIRPTFSEIEKSSYKGKELHGFEKYLAYFASGEKGFIVFNHNSVTRSLELCFENHGRDTININGQSVWNIKTQLLKWEIKDIKIKDLDNNIIYSISMNEIKNQILNKKIEPNQKIKILLISSETLQKNASYHILIGTTGKKPILEEKITPSKKVVRWIIGADPYYHPRHWDGDDLYIYLLDIEKDGSISFKKKGK